jgi:hypothetical protein
VPAERAGHKPPAGAVDTREERSAPESEAMEPVEPKPAETRMAPSADATPTADMTDANMANADVTHAHVTPEAARRSAGRGQRQRERGARRCRDCQLTQHFFPPDANASRTFAAHTRINPARTRTGTAYVDCNTASAQTLRRFIQFFRRGIGRNQTITVRQTAINKYSSRKLTFMTENKHS